LEEKADLSKDVFVAESLMIEFLAAFNKVIYKILSKFHETLGFENSSEIEK